SGETANRGRPGSPRPLVQAEIVPRGPCQNMTYGGPLWIHPRASPRIEPPAAPCGGTASGELAASPRRARPNSSRLAKKMSVMIVAYGTHQMQIACMTNNSFDV